MPKLSDLLWDYVPDKQAFQGMGNDLLAAANRGGVAAVLGAPVDIANQLANLGRALYGYAGNKAGLLSADQMPQLEDKPIGGSEWIGQQMQDAGLINGNRNALAELLAGMVMPGAMLRGGVKANQAMDAAIANAQRPNTLNTPGYKGQRGAVGDPGTVKIQSWPEWQKSNPGMDTNESYAAWKRAAGDAVSGEANRLSEMLRARGISATFGGGLNPANSAFPYHNAVGGVSSYMNVPGVGEVRFSDHMRGSGMGNDMTFGNADEAFSAITKLLDTKAAKQSEAARLRQDIGIADEMTRKEKMQRLQEWIAEQGFNGKDKDLYPWINKLGL